MKKLKRLLASGAGEALRVAPGTRVRLGGYGCEGADIPGMDKERSEELFPELHAELAKLQDLLYAEHKHKVLVVLQAMDTAGKDSVIKHVFQGVNPQGVRVASFKSPTPDELDHDFLWRVHAQAPAKGMIAIFNRSHYEDVLISRVHGLVPEKVWRQRYRHISEFERMLAQEGTLILKFFLHIDKREQGKRLQQRLDDPAKNWKFSGQDMKERALWGAYMRAYEDAIRHTGSAWAPWYVIPSNRRWYRNLAVSLVLINALRGLKMRYPKKP